MGIENPGKTPERQEAMSPEAVLKYVEKMGIGLQQAALAAQAMIAEAKERGINVDLSQNPALKKFEPLNENEVALIHLQADLNTVKIDLLNQGVRMTQEDLDARLKKMSASTSE